MNDDELKEAHAGLKATISKDLWNFSDKYFNDLCSENMYQAGYIMQAVLSESASAIEYTIGRMAPLTSRQIDHICTQIDDWYLMLKPLLEGQRNLGYMKEKLKTMICGEK